MNETNASVPAILSGDRSFTLSLHVAGGIIIATVLVTCCCTLIVRHKCARLFHKFTGKRKKEKYFPPDIEQGWKKRATARDLRKKRKAPVSRDLGYAETPGPEVTAPIIPKELERSDNASPVTCYKCYRKKKRGGRPKRR